MSIQERRAGALGEAGMKAKEEWVSRTKEQHSHEVLAGNSP
jgi:hypothetical protein